MKKNLSAAAIFALASAGMMNQFFDRFAPHMPSVKAKKNRNWMTPHEGAQQAERGLRQGVHMAVVNGFPIMQRKSAKELRAS